jgi:hypothetical protein
MTRKALCIGIDDYREREPAPGAAPGSAREGDPEAGTPIPPDAFHLRGAVNDALAWAHLLARHYDFASVRLLLNTEATSANVIDGLEWLVDGAAADDVLAVVFSGHSSYEVDTATLGSSNEMFDEAIVSYDGLISDDRIASIVRDFEGSLTMVSDSCYSAGILDIELDDPKPDEHSDGRGYRPKGYRPKGYRPKGYRPKFIPPHARVGSAPPSGRTRRVRESRPYEVLLAACDSDQIAFDDDFSGTAHGVFTHYALEVIEAARYRLTYEDLMRHTAARIPRSAFDQVPKLEGGEEMRKMPLFTHPGALAI